MLFRSKHLASGTHLFALGSPHRCHLVPAPHAWKDSKAARRNRAKANNMNRNFAIFLAALGILIVFCSINYLKLKTECTSKRSQLATLESQLAELKEDNDAYESQVTSSVDLERIRKIAIGRLGMKYPSNQQTETYTTEGGSFVRQYQEVTGK